MITVNNAVKFSNKKQPNDMELKGLSTDVKPTEVNGNRVGVNSIFLELDTNDFYYFDGEEWQKVVIEGGGSGEYDRDIAEIRNELKKRVYYFDNVASMKSSKDLKGGEYVVTKGYYEKNDGGGASYLIRAKTEEDVDDGGSIHFIENSLVAELIPQNNTINIKQFGCVEDNTSDVTQYVSKAVNYATNNNINTIKFNNNKYIITENIIINSISFIGNKTKFEFHLETGEPLFWFSGTFTLKDIEFTLVSSSSYKYVFRIENSNNVTLEHCILQKGADFRTNNQNLTCINCNFNESVTVRELSNNLSQNIKFIDCHIERQDVDVDEVIWCVSSRGTLRNISFENCYIAHNGGSENCIAISSYYENGICENIQFNNCYFDLKSKYSTFHIGGSTQSIKGTTKNVQFNNCTIKHHNFTSTTYLFLNDSPFSVYLNNCNVETEECTIGFNNTIFNNCDITIIARDCLVDCKVYNSNINATRESTTVFLGGAEVYNSKITTTYRIGIIQVSQHTNTKQEFYNCKLIGSGNFYLFTNSASNGFTKLVACEITNPENTIFYGSGLTESLIWNIYLDFCNFLDGIDNLCNGATLKIHAFNILSNGDIITGIPTRQNVRNGLVVNTLIQANTTDGLFYKKISEGNSVSNWTLYNQQAI